VTNPLRQRLDTLQRQWALNAQLRAMFQGRKKKRPTANKVATIARNCENLVAKGASINQWIRFEDGTMELPINIALQHDHDFALRLLKLGALANQGTLLFLAEKAQNAQQYKHIFWGFDDPATPWKYEEFCRFVVEQPGLDWHQVSAYERIYLFMDNETSTIAHSIDGVMPGFSKLLETTQQQKGWPVGRPLPTPTTSRALDLALQNLCDPDHRDKHDLDDRQTLARMKHFLALGANPNFSLSNKELTATEIYFNKLDLNTTNLLLSYGGRVREQFIGKIAHALGDDDDHIYHFLMHDTGYRERKINHVRAMIFQVLKYHSIDWHRNIRFVPKTSWREEIQGKLHEIVEQTLPDMMCEAQAQHIEMNTLPIAVSAGGPRRL
jgi:hypothetical protein